MTRILCPYDEPDVSIGFCAHNRNVKHRFDIVHSPSVKDEIPTTVPELVNFTAVPILKWTHSIHDGRSRCRSSEHDYTINNKF